MAPTFKWNKEEMDLECLLTVFQTKVSLDAIISFHLLPELCTSVVSFVLISSHKLLLSPYSSKQLCFVPIAVLSVVSGLCRVLPLPPLFDCSHWSVQRSASDYGGYWPS